MRSLPDHLVHLFWDVDPKRIDIDRDRTFVLERIMARGDWTAMKWLQGHYDRRELADYLVSHGTRLSPRTYAYWSLVCDVQAEQRPGGARPQWAG